MGARLKRLVIALLVGPLMMAGCASEFSRAPAPAESWRLAASPVTPFARYWGDAPPANADELSADLAASFRARRARLAARGARRPFSILALSSGAEDGAYGAGVLVGWSKAGDRPEFDVVTGVSTGALIAPLAFLGEKYDPALVALFTETSTEDLVVFRPFKVLLGALGVGDTAPFREAIAQVVTKEFLAEVAAADRDGRKLFIATTNLDAKRPVFWDMGAIARQGDDEALQLFRDVMLASASIPGAFPPVFMDVKIGDKTYQEMHVDGGVMVSTFIAPSWVRFNRRLLASIGRDPVIYVIYNNKVKPAYEPTQDKFVGIASTAISEMIRSQGRADQLRIYAIAERVGLAYRATVVPGDFDAMAGELFDPEYMSALFRVGFKFGATKSRRWLREPPDLPASLRRTARRN